METKREKAAQVIFYIACEIIDHSKSFYVACCLCLRFECNCIAKYPNFIIATPYITHTHIYIYVYVRK